MSALSPQAIHTIQLMINSIPAMMGTSRTLQMIRTADCLPGMATFLRPDPENNLSLIRFHRDFHFEDFPDFEAKYRNQYTSFQGKFAMLFDLQWVDWTTLKSDTLIAFLTMVESLKEYRMTHLHGICLLLPTEYEQLTVFFQQILSDLSNDTTRLITSNIEKAEEFIQMLFAHK